MRKKERNCTCTPALSNIIPSGAYVVPLTPYSVTKGLLFEDSTTHICTYRNMSRANAG